MAKSSEGTKLVVGVIRGALAEECKNPRPSLHKICTFDR